MMDNLTQITSPLILDETGNRIANCLDKQNAYLAMLAEGRRSDIYSSMSQIAGIVRGNSVEQNARIFPIGDQIIMPWKDMDDANHNTDETAYQVEWDIVHHGLVTLQDGSIVPGMFLMMHKASPYGVQFSHEQAFLNCPDGLAAGTYYVTFGVKWGNNGADAGTSWQFTLTQAVPAGGRLSGFENLPNKAPSDWRVKSWTSPTAANPIETVTVTAGAGGTSLGTIQMNAADESALNGLYMIGFGHNRWSTSGIRQYLNSTGANWFASKEDFDIRPNEHGKQGFMSGFNADFLSAIKPVKVTTALNTVEGFAETSEDTFDTFFLPSLEQMNAKPQLAGVEGDYFEYWRRRLGLSDFAKPNIRYDAYKIPAINTNSSQNVRLRSAVRHGVDGSWILNYSGYVSNNTHGYYAATTTRFSPVCVVC